MKRAEEGAGVRDWGLERREKRRPPRLPHPHSRPPPPPPRPICSLAPRTCANSVPMKHMGSPAAATLAAHHSRLQERACQSPRPPPYWSTWEGKERERRGEGCKYQPKLNQTKLN